MPLTLSTVLADLVESTLRQFDWQITDRDHSDYGGPVNPTHKLPEAAFGGAPRLIMACALLVHAHEKHPDALPANMPPVDLLLERMDIALDFLARQQRPSGLVDLYTANFDSSPDAGFNVEALASVYALTRESSLLAANLQKVEAYIRSSFDGLVTGGFHTPNHRWVMTSAMTQTVKLFDDLEATEIINGYLAEGFDIDEDGAYIERSVGIYDTVTNRALLFIAENWPDEVIRASAIEAVGRNLAMDLHLLHADGSAETGLSRRQDYGTRSVPARMIIPLVMYGQITGNTDCIAAAHFLWDRAGETVQSGPTLPAGAHWHAYALMKYGELPEVAPHIPDEYVTFYAKNQVWRNRAGNLSASVFGGVTRLMTLTCGDITLSSMKISQAYFGVGSFIAETMTATDDSVTLHSSGAQRLHKPGYELPLGRPVAPDDWESSLAERDFRYIAPAESELTVTAAPGGLDFHFRTLDGLDRATVQIALDFPAGGIWETDESAFVTAPGQTILFKSGVARMQFGDDVLTIEPGAYGHRTFIMRDTEPVPHDHTRVLLTFRTPVDFHFAMRVSRGVSGA